MVLGFAGVDYMTYRRKNRMALAWNSQDMSRVMTDTPPTCN
jgi:hypothetical protein